jgi:hypothetical protein
MNSLAKTWLIDGLKGLGAEVEHTGDTAMLLMEKTLSSSLGLDDYCQLRFTPGSGDNGVVFAGVELFDKIESLTAALGRCASARLRPDEKFIWPSSTKAEDFFKLTNGKLVFNEVSVQPQTYTLCFCRCSAVSDEKRQMVISAAVNDTTATVAPDLGYALESLLESDRIQSHSFAPQSPSPQTLETLFAVLRYQTSVQLHDFTESLTNRLTRDCERIHSYYRELLTGVHTPSSRKKLNPKELIERTTIIKTDFAKKIEDLRIKYLMKVDIEPVALLSVELPCSLARFTAYMGALSREVSIAWNPLTARADRTLCIHCRRPAESIRLCREFHWLCDECWKTCDICKKQYCPICKPKGCVH